ncbi:MAG: hypothetical protein H7Y59_10765 [Anaerolineales bacterium]|nr:hypothetical protein [Anaerolineales bacterium]
MKIKLFSIIILVLLLLPSCQPMNTATTSIEIKTPTPASKHALVLEKVTETKNGYILLGRFYSIEFPDGFTASGDANNTIITDANGQNISWAFPKDTLSLTGETGNFPWAYEIEGKEHAWPLTITFNSVRADVTDTQAEFDFDTGPNPQGGQKWTVDEDIAINGYSVHVDNIRLYKGMGYIVKFAYNPDIAEVELEIVNAENPGSTFIGGSSSWEVVEGIHSGISYNLQYEGEVPSGKMKIRFNKLWVNIKGKWQLQWQPDAVP